MNDEHHSFLFRLMINYMDVIYVLYVCSVSFVVPKHSTAFIYWLSAGRALGSVLFMAQVKFNLTCSF